MERSRMTGKLIKLFEDTELTAGGTFSNLMAAPKSDEEMIRDLRDALAKVNRMKMQVVPKEKLVLPPDWETWFPPWVVAAIKRLYGV